MNPTIRSVLRRAATWAACWTLVLTVGGRWLGAAGPYEQGPPPPTAKLIDFSVRLEPADPFAESNQAGDTPSVFRRGEVFTLVIKGTPKPGYHTYPATQRGADPVQEEDMASKLAFEPPPGVSVLGPLQESTPQWAIMKNYGVFLEFEHPFTWSQDFLVKPDAAPGPKTLSFRINLQVCDTSCTPGAHRFQVPFTVSDAPPLSASVERPRAPLPQGLAVVPVPADLQDKTSTWLQEHGAREDAGTDQLSGKGETPLTGLLLAAMGAAVGMLLTPCVFPMIPITVSFFLKQSEREHHNAVLTATVYSATIIVVLALAVLVLGQLIVVWANDPWLNLALGLLLVVFALSLFGMYELELPHFLARFTSSREGKGGYVGAIFMALTFTITSFTCTGPFLGPLLVATKEMQLGTGRLVLAAFTYSATFAAPFFVLALFPGLMKKLPRSGGWLNAVKVVMGFLELAAALKFLANTDLSWNPGNARLFNYETVICAWIALSAACGLYLLGVFRLPHDTPVENIGVPRMILATIFFGLVLYMIPALQGKVPQGAVGEAIVAFAPHDSTGKDFLDYQEAWQRAVAENKELFIDFTGVNCTNCRANEKNVFNQSTVRQQMEKYVVVRLYTDSVPKKGLSAGEASREAVRNLALQRQTFGDISLPMYVILRPDRARPEADGKLQGAVLGRYKGLITDVPEFMKFLQGRQQTLVARQ